GFGTFYVYKSYVSPVVIDFFFQAEDGIRDFHVTGVQTCALPISGRPGTCRDGYRDERPLPPADIRPETPHAPPARPRRHPDQWRARATPEPPRAHDPAHRGQPPACPPPARAIRHGPPPRACRRGRRTAPAGSQRSGWRRPRRAFRSSWHRPPASGRDRPPPRE